MDLLKGSLSMQLEPEEMTGKPAERFVCLAHPIKVSLPPDPRLQLRFQDRKQGAERHLHLEEIVIRWMRLKDVLCERCQQARRIGKGGWRLAVREGIQGDHVPHYAQSRNAARVG